MEGIANLTTTAERSLIGRIGAAERWARTTDRRAATAPARAALMTKWEREVDPDGTLDPAERAYRASQAQRAHMHRLALASAQARQRRKVRNCGS